jgi:3-hydroxyisobutyrate dehydrogenase
MTAGADPEFGWVSAQFSSRHFFEDPLMSTIAFLGTGLLGGAFAQAAAQRGDTVTAWNRSPDKVHALAQFGVIAAASPAEAVQGASRVHLVLKDDAVVDEVLAAARAGLLPDAIIIDHSTTLPVLTAARAERLQAEGVNYLHCPVFMGPPAARQAQGTMMVAGPKALFERVQPELARMTGRLEYMGERADLAAVNKLFGNAMIIGVSALMADILTMAQASEVSAEDAVKLLGFLDLNAMVAGRGLNMAKGNFSPSFELTMARKDVRLMLEAAGDRPLAVLPLVASRMDQLIAAGHGADDCCVLGIDAVPRR